MAGRPSGLADEKSSCWSRLQEAWVEAVGETHIRVRPTASPFGETVGNDHEVRWLHWPEGFVVVKGHGFI
jgi:hypothetical protein